MIGALSNLIYNFRSSITKTYDYSSIDFFVQFRIKLIGGFIGGGRDESSGNARTIGLFEGAGRIFISKILSRLTGSVPTEVVMRVFHQSSVSRGGYYISTLSSPSMFTVVEEKSLSGEILFPFLFYFIENINITMKLVKITPKFDM